MPRIFPSDAMEWAIVAIVIALAALALYKLRRVDFSGLIQELNVPKASLSRFQFLIFTFVVAGVFTILSLQQGEFVEVGPGVLGLLGISGTSYAVSKSISGGPAKRDAGAQQ